MMDDRDMYTPENAFVPSYCSKLSSKAMCILFEFFVLFDIGDQLICCLKYNNQFS